MQFGTVTYDHMKCILSEAYMPLWWPFVFRNWLISNYPKHTPFSNN